MIPQANPRANYLSHKQEIDEAIAQVLDGGQYVLGEQVELFEKEFAQWIGVNHCVSVANGTDAIRLALMALEIGDGDEVLLPSLTAVATVSAIVQTGATPVYVDVDKDTLTISARDAKEKITEDTKAIIPVHLYGNPCDVDLISDIAREHFLMVVNDCSQAHGAMWQRRRLGHSRINTFSFYPTKNLGAIGDGGAITTNSESIAKKIKQLRQYGWNSLRESKRHGINSRLDELQAAILRVKLRHLDDDNEKRIYIAATYRFAEVPTYWSYSPATSCWHQYVALCKDKEQRDGLADFLSQNDIQTAIHYAVPCHKHPAYFSDVSLPVTEDVCQRILSLPMWPELPIEDVARVAKLVSEYLS